MMRLFSRCGLLILLLTAGAAPAAERPAVFTGRVLDVDGRTVEGARIFVYTGPQVKRTADFISSSTGSDGRFRMVLPQGRFWSIARLKRSDDYGPLTPGDKHSGEPTEIELASGGEVVHDFTVADIKDALRKRMNEREKLVSIRGKIVDDKGGPLRGAYAFATKSQTAFGIPEYVSAWTDIEGSYALYVPPGTYFVGGALLFPPGTTYFLHGEMTIKVDVSGLDLVNPSGKSSK